MLEEAERKNITTWVEPFVGGANLIDKVPPNFKRIGIDFNPHTICALIDIRDRANDLPDTIDEETYRNLRGTMPESESSWVRFVCSFGGKFENGFARSRKGDRGYAAEGKRNAQAQSPNIQGVDFINASYDDIYFENCVIYCDPPYEGTTGYKTGAFDHKKFWTWAVEMSRCNLVFISEYNAPEDFVSLWEGEIKTTLNCQQNSTLTAVEKLFTLNPFLLNGC